MSIMMLIGGIMITIGGIRNTGNDTITLPSLIVAAGAIFTFWGFYRVGYLKANYDIVTKDDKTDELKIITLQIIETLVYLAITLVGLWLLLNQNSTNRIMNLMTGGFTIFNGIMGVIYEIKHRADRKSFKWIFRAVLTVVELILGVLFIIFADSIVRAGFIIMGIITIIAGVIEVFSALTKESLEKTVKDGKDIIKALKEDK